MLNKNKYMEILYVSHPITFTPSYRVWAVLNYKPGFHSILYVVNALS